MPKRDGRAQMGRRSMSGRGLGFGNGANPPGGGNGAGIGCGRGRGYGKGFGCLRNLRKCSQTYLSGSDQEK